MLGVPAIRPTFDMLPRNVIHQTMERFPAYAEESFEVSPLEKGGSDRKFYRIHSNQDHSMIVVKYSGQKEENRHYVDIAEFLDSTGVNVPKVYFHDPSEGLIWMQDLGTEDLWAFRHEPWDVRGPYYEKVLEQAAILHTESTRRVEGSGLKLEREFSHQLYLWEQNYFFEHCLGAHFGLDPEHAQRYAELPALQAIATRLAELPRTIVHRDFQSQNILIHRGEAFMIDFQGMRPGVPQYDVASLLYDPYVDLSSSERTALLAAYHRLAQDRGLELGDDFEAVFYQCALQRLMQALGAYGFLGLQKGRQDFLTHIPAARRSLREVAAHLDGLDPFVKLLDSLP